MLLLLSSVQCPRESGGKTDKTIVEKIIKSDLGIRDVKIEEVIRLGVGKEPRPILLKLNDTQTRRTVLSKAKACHLEQVHSTEVKVAAALAFPKKSKERKLWWDALRNRCNFFHNTQVIKKGSGRIVPYRRLALDTDPISYVLCSACLAGGPMETCQELSQAASLSITQYEDHSSSTPKSWSKQQASPSPSTKTIPHQHQRSGPSSKPLHHTVRRPFLINTKEHASPSHSTKTIPHQHQRAGPSSKHLHHTVRRPFLINTKEHASPSLSTKAIPHQHQRASFARLPFNDNATDPFKTNILKGMKYDNCNVTLCIKCRYNIFTCRGQVV